MSGASKSIEKQNKAAKKQTGNRPGKWQADDLSQLKGLPGIKTIKGRKKKL